MFDKARKGDLELCVLSFSTNVRAIFVSSMFQDNLSPAKTISDNAATSGNDTTNSEPNRQCQSNVEKLASALGNKVTIKVNPENSGR